MKNFHVPLPAELYRQLQTEAKQSQQPATQLARQAIVQWLEEQKRRAVHEQIAAFAEQWAGSDLDLDESLESAGIEHLLESPS